MASAFVTSALQRAPPRSNTAAASALVTSLARSAGNWGQQWGSGARPSGACSTSPHCALVPQRSAFGLRNQRINGKRLLKVQAFSQEDTFPFVEADYHRVELLNRPPYGPMKILPASDQYANSYSGVLVFQRSTEPTLTPDTPILEIFVAGDVAGLIYTQLHGHKANRPMVHDLMFDIIQRAAQVSRDQWQLLRVAVVALENDIFVGRLYFGDPVTGKVMWDCDCRPSDGIALGLKTGCPFFVARSVWDQAAVSICKSKVHMIAVHEAHMAVQAQQQQQAAPQQQQQQQSAAQQPPATQQQQQQVGGTSAGSGGSPAKTARGSRELPVGPGSNNDRMGGSTSLSSHDDYTALKASDPDVIKLLKRELEVAVNEEDYAAAIRLRDHPYMQLYRRVEAFTMVGAADEAASLQRELDALIARDSTLAQ